MQFIVFHEALNQANKEHSLAVWHFIAGIRSRTRLSLHISQGPSCFVGSIILARNLLLPAPPLSLLFFLSASITRVPPQCLIERELLSICRIHERIRLVSGVYYYYYPILYFCRSPSWVEKAPTCPPGLPSLRGQGKPCLWKEVGASALRYLVGGSL